MNRRPNDKNPFSIYDTPHAVQRSAISRRTAEIDIAPEEVRSGQFAPSIALPSQRFSMRILYAFMIAALIILSARAFYLQLLQSNSFRSTAEGNRIAEVRSYAPRGNVEDLQGNVVAQNKTEFQLRIDPIAYRTDNQAGVQQLVQELLQISSEDLATRITAARKNSQEAVLSDHLPYEDALKMMVRIREFPSLHIEEQYTREYPKNDLYAHILGYTSKISAEEYQYYKQKQYALDAVVGKAGIEKSYEEQLHGADGFTRNEVDFRGNIQRTVDVQHAVAGSTLRLTIDGRLQELLYERLKKVVDEQKLPGASAVAIDPRDGSVRALVSYPSYDNNAFTGGVSHEIYDALLKDERKPLLNRAISGEFPSGSTFKPVVAAAGLEEKVISPSTTVVSTGGLKVGPYLFPDWRAGGHGVTDIRKAIADSVNTFFYLLGGGDNNSSTGLGVERIVSYARKFGMASRTGIDIGGERPGFLPSKAWKEEYKNEPWYLGDTYHLAIGQGDILVTPLQVAVFTAIIANGGTYYQPHLVQGVIDPVTDVEQATKPIIKNEQVVSRETIDVVREGMRSTVTAGSARSLSTALSVTSAAKTGTAQFGKKDKTHAWFSVFAPYEEPTIALAVLVEEGGGSNDTAVPIAREVLAEYFKPKTE